MAQQHSLKQQVQEHQQRDVCSLQKPKVPPEERDVTPCKTSQPIISSIIDVDEIIDLSD